MYWLCVLEFGGPFDSGAGVWVGDEGDASDLRLRGRHFEQGPEAGERIDRFCAARSDDQRTTAKLNSQFTRTITKKNGRRERNCALVVVLASLSRRFLMTCDRHRKLL